eukprot:211912-Rhodomonas_salina.1
MLWNAHSRPSSLGWVWPLSGGIAACGMQFARSSRVWAPDSCVLGSVAALHSCRWPAASERSLSLVCVAGLCRWWSVSLVCLASLSLCGCGWHAVCVSGARRFHAGREQGRRARVREGGAPSQQGQGRALAWLPAGSCEARGR